MRVWKRSPRAARAVVMALTAVLTLGCGGGGGDGGGGVVNPPVLTPSTVTFESGNSVNGTVGVALATAVAVVVRASDNRPVPRTTVTFSVSAGTLASTSAQTDDNGRAAVGTWTLGTTTGAQTLTAQAGSANAQLVATAAAGAAARLEIVTPLPASVRAGALISPPPAVRARDQYNNIVNRAGIVVTAILQAGVATLSGTDATTDASGLATFSALTIGGAVSAGVRTIGFTSNGVPAVAATPIALDPGTAATLTLQNVPAIARAGVPIAPGVTVSVTDQFNNPLSRPATTVTVSVAQGGGAVGGGTASTDTDGRATFPSLSIDGIIGTKQLRFAADQVSTTTAAITLFPGDPAQVAVLSQPARAENTVAFTTPVRVVVADRFTNAVGGQSRDVFAALAAGGGSLLSSVAHSDAAGFATFSALRLVGVVGAKTIAYGGPGLASTNGPPIQLDAGPVRLLSIVAGLAPTVTLGVPFPQQPAVQLADTSGNLVQRAGVTVRATLENAIGEMVNDVAASDAQGIALFSQLTILPIGAAPASIRVRFGSGSLASVVTGNITVQLPGANSVARVDYGDPARRLYLVDPGQALPLVAVLRDAGGSLVNGVTPVYSSSNTIAATVLPSGAIVGQSGGSAWVRAFGAGAPAIRDSVYVTVLRDATAPVVYTSRLTPIPVRSGVVSDFDVLLDTRGVPVGAATIIIGLPPELVGGISWAGTNGTIIGFDSRLNALRISYVASAGATGVVNLAHVSLTSGAPQSFVLNREIIITPVEMVSLDLLNLATRSTGANIPLVP